MTALFMGVALSPRPDYNEIVRGLVAKTARPHLFSNINISRKGNLPMYDHNPFREAKKIYENMSPEEITAYKKQLGAMLDPIGAKYGNPMAQNRENMRADLAKKRKHHEELVRKGELTQAEFDRLEKMGEFEIKEAAEREYDDFDIGPQAEEMPGADEYEAKMENDKHEAMIKDKLLGFLGKKPHDPLTKQVHHEIYRARIHANPHEQDSSVVRVAGQTFIVPHGHSPHIKVVS
jgi:hypothetical protein